MDTLGPAKCHERGNMQVRLIALTKPMIPECEAAGDLLAYCARVSNPAN